MSGWAQGFPTVYLYDTLGPDALEYILNHAEITVLVCSQDKTDRVLSVAEKCPLLKTIIELPSDKKSDLKIAKQLRMISYDEVTSIVRSIPFFVHLIFCL